MEGLYIGSPLLISLDIFCRWPKAEDCALRALAELKLRADTMHCCPEGQRGATFAPAFGLRSLCALHLPRLSLSALCSTSSRLCAVYCVPTPCCAEGAALAHPVSHVLHVAGCFVCAACTTPWPGTMPAMLRAGLMPGAYSLLYAYLAKDRQKHSQ